MATHTYRVDPLTAKGAIRYGYFTITMDDATRKRYEASTPKEQSNFIKFNGTFHPVDVMINVVKGVDKLEKIT